MKDIRKINEFIRKFKKQQITKLTLEKKTVLHTKSQLKEKTASSITVK